MVVGDLVGEIAVCSDCHQKKKIGLELSREAEAGKKGQMLHLPLGQSSIGQN